MRIHKRGQLLRSFRVAAFNFSQKARNVIGGRHTGATNLFIIGLSPHCAEVLATSRRSGPPTSVTRHIPASLDEIVSSSSLAASASNEYLLVTTRPPR